MVTLERIEKISGCLRHMAFDPANSRGRRCNKSQPLNESDLYDIDICYGGLENAFKVDRRKILNSKSFRRSVSKTQVFTSPINNHVRTRATHMLEVAELAVQIAEILGLNSELCDGIASGHDIGHAPFGHLGEDVISEQASKKQGRKVKIRHEVMSVVVAQEIERNGRGLNLSYETLEGIWHHSRGLNGLAADPSLPMEYAVVMLADKISYTASDLKDTGRYEFPEIEQTSRFGRLIGTSQREMVKNCVDALLIESAEEGIVSFVRSDTAKLFEEMRHWMYENVYKKVDREANIHALTDIYTFLQTFPATCDCDPALLIWMMSDSDVIDLFNQCLKSPYLTEEALHKYAFWELLPVLKEKQINYESPDLSWGNQP